MSHDTVQFSTIYLRDLAPIVFRNGEKGNFCVLCFYMDDSADRGRQKVLSVSGFVAYADTWFELERKWEQRVKRDGVDYFRTYDCKSLDKEFRKLVDKHGLTTARVLADAMLADLKKLVKEAKVAAFCLAVLMDDYRQVLTEPRSTEVLKKDPYVEANYSVMHRVGLSVRKMKRPEPVTFVYDEHSKGHVLQAGWEDFKKNNPEGSKLMASLQPLDDKTTPALQVADLIANTTTEMFIAHLENPEKGEQVIREWLPRVQEVVYLNKAYLRGLVHANLPENRVQY